MDLIKMVHINLASFFVKKSVYLQASFTMRPYLYKSLSPFNASILRKVVPETLLVYGL